MRPQRATVAEIDLSAIAHNVAVMKEFAGTARLLAVVKANGYGHGAVSVAETA
ncbi:MAG: alanine racemase, partial [Actinobacteria bacterium]|nr:alanine racemase [Actinomycetota bacterium]